MSRLAVPAKELNRRAKQARRLCNVLRILDEEGVRAVTVASMLKISAKTLNAWSEGYETIPPAVFEVIDAAFRRHTADHLPDPGASFLELLTRHARAAGLRGF